MKYSRLAALALLSVSLTSCQTLGGFMNTWPVKMMDQTASSVLGMFSENDLPVSGKPATLQERAREVESRGIYAGRGPAAVAPRQSMAAR
ncbi:MAG: hypothetical protein U1F71_01290 [Verrucomicrobiaceae bacterium]